MFCQVVATGINVIQHYQKQARAASGLRQACGKPLAGAGRIYYVRCQYLQFFLVHFYPIVPQFSSAATAYPGRETFYYSWRLYLASLYAFSVNFP